LDLTKSFCKTYKLLSRHQSDRAKHARRMNQLFISRLSYVIQSIFNPREAGPAQPGLEAQVKYFAQRFKCEYFGGDVNPNTALASTDVATLHASTIVRTETDASMASDSQSTRTSVTVDIDARTEQTQTQSVDGQAGALPAATSSCTQATALGPSRAPSSRCSSWSLQHMRRGSFMPAFHHKVDQRNPHP
jgi:hypothetical protein